VAFYRVIYSAAKQPIGILAADDRDFRVFSQDRGIARRFLGEIRAQAQALRRDQKRLGATLLNRVRGPYSDRFSLGPVRETPLGLDTLLSTFRAQPHQF